jgi:hypothetical protein
VSKRCHPLVVTAAAVLLIKLATFIADPTPLFFMGDSRAYIAAAIQGEILWGLSSGYGLPVRWFAVWPGTLTTLVLAQVLAGAAAAWMLALMLLRFFKVRPAIALTTAIVCTLEPLHVIHERLVLAEAFTQLLFASHLLLGLWYLSRPRLLPLMAVCIIGILLVSLRVVYVPLALSAPLVLTVLALARSAAPAFDRRTGKYVVHLAVAIVVTLCLHAGYRHLIGALTNGSPTYLPGRGDHLAAAWLPLLNPEDASDARARRVLKGLLVENQGRMPGRFARERQRWNDDGFTVRLRQAFGGDSHAANLAAVAMATRAFQRDPLAVVALTVQTYGDYWRILPFLNEKLLVEQGTGRALEVSFLQALSKHFRLDAAHIPVTMTPSKRYHLAFHPWYVFLLLSPFVMLLSVSLAPRGRRSGAAYVFLASTILLIATCAGSLLPYWRYLLPVAFGSLLAMGIIADWLYQRVAPENETTDESCRPE